MATTHWEVVGGGSSGGILVRQGQQLKSQEEANRLLRGAVVEELKLVGERLQYRLVEGEGPVTGWVSLKQKGADLLVQATGTKWVPDAGAAPLELGDWRIVGRAKLPNAPGAHLHICLCVISETGHMTPMLRIARGLVGRASVRKVTIVTNAFGAGKLRSWLQDAPDASCKIELVAFEDGWTQELQDWSNQYAQEEDGKYFGQCNDGLTEHSKRICADMNQGPNKADLFVTDFASGGYNEVIDALEPQPLRIGSVPLCIFIAQPFETRERPDHIWLWHCFELPPLLKVMLPKPLADFVVPVGIVAEQYESSSIPPDILEFLERPGPVVYVSMGSVATFTREQLAMVSEALKAPGEWRVLWSLREGQQALLPEGGAKALGDDFLVSKWLPQAALLQHEKVVAFMSHCGWGATCEAILSATPVVAFPMFADQGLNAIFLEMFGMAKTVTMPELDFKDPASFQTRFKTIVANYLSSEANQKMLQTTTEIEKAPKVRDTFTAEGLRNDVRLVVSRKDLTMKAKWLRSYNHRYGSGAAKAAEEVEKYLYRMRPELAELAAK